MMKYLPALFSCVLFFISLSVFKEEMAVFSRPRPSQLDFYWFQASENNTDAISEYSKTRVLKDCNYSLSSPIGMSLPPDVRNAAAKRCVSLSESIAVAMPTNSFAWLINAKGNITLANSSGFYPAFLRSQALAKNERWLAEQRMILVRSFGREQDLQLQAAIQQDISTLLEFNHGFLFVLDLYRMHEGFRGSIEQTLEQKSGAIQQRFLYRLQHPASADSDSSADDGLGASK